MMDFRAWYTDTVDIYRVVSVKDGNLTRHERKLISSGIACRMYQSDSKPPTMSQDAASIKEENNLACDNSVDIQAGDELILRRGAKLGQNHETFRAFAGDPNHYYEPFGAVIPGLAHQQVKLLKQERIQGGTE